MDTKYLAQRSMRHGGPVAALPAALLVVTLLSAAAVAAPPQGEPSAPPATQPAEAGTSVMISGAPTTSPAKVSAIVDRLSITEIDRTVLDAVRDDTRQIDETGLYVGLGIAARAAGNLQLDPQEWSQLDRPAYVSLLAEPKRWRARPIQVTVRIFLVTKLMSGEGLNYSGFWPKDHPVWRMDGLLSDQQAGPEQPIMIFSVVNPVELLGLGEPGAGKAEMEYKRGPQVRVAAIFYKDLIDKDRDGAVRVYPVVMAWQLSRGEDIFARQPQASDGLMTKLAPVAIVVIALAGGFYLLRRRMVQLRKGGLQQGPRYQPLRGPAATPGGPKEAANPEDVYVDPELAAAVEQFHHDHPKGHDETEGTAGAAGKNRHG